jgi:hypothetical protein
MVVLRRLTALVTMLVTLVLVLAESGFACSSDDMAGMRADATGGSAAMGDMAGMPMPGMSGAPATPSHDHGRGPAQAPCRFPWAPAGCRDMAPCAPAALAVAAPVASEPMPAHDAVVQVRVSAPRSVETPPEPPPPRA